MRPEHPDMATPAGPRSPSAPPRSRGYSLIEVMVAVSIIMGGVAAAAQMSLVMSQQEETSYAVQRGLSLGEAAHQLYQLGMSTGECLAILPADHAVDVQAAASTLDTSALATAEATDWTVTVAVRQGTADVRTFGIKSVRPSIR